MRIASYVYQGQRHVGQVSPDGQHVTAFDLTPHQVRLGAQALIEGWVAGQPFPSLSGTPLPVSSVRLQAPLPVPRRNIWCVGRNYHAHAKELAASVFKASNTDTQAWPIVFTKVPECVVGPTDEVCLPGAGISEQIDYEAELAVVIGKGGKNIAQADAMAHVFGYTIVNDVTARDVQMRHQQWDMGKSFDTFCPMGPWLVTADEVGDVTKLRVTAEINGEKRQDALVKDLIFDIPTLIETITSVMTLLPGDIIATGTPAGVGIGFNPPKFLTKGDRMKLEISGLGVLENPVV